MPALQVKDFPSDLYDGLRECAAEQDRNISQQTVHILREYLRAYKQLGGSIGWEASGAESEANQKPALEIFTDGKVLDQEAKMRIERRKRAFEKIDALPKPKSSSNEPGAAELIRQMREERDARIDFSFDEEAGRQ